MVKLKATGRAGRPYSRKGPVQVEWNQVTVVYFDGRLHNAVKDAPGKPPAELRVVRHPSGACRKDR